MNQAQQEPNHKPLYSDILYCIHPPLTAPRHTERKKKPLLITKVFYVLHLFKKSNQRPILNETILQRKTFVKAYKQQTVF